MQFSWCQSAFMALMLFKKIMRLWYDLVGLDFGNTVCFTDMLNQDCSAPEGFKWLKGIDTMIFLDLAMLLGSLNSVHIIPEDWIIPN